MNRVGFLRVLRPWVAVALAQGLLLSACESRQEAKFEAFVLPRSVVPVGGKAHVGVRVVDPSPGLELRCRATLGAFDPKESAELISTYTAPRQAGNDEVFVEVIQGDRVAFSDKLLITVVGESGKPVTSTTVNTIAISTLPPYDEVGGPGAWTRIAGRVSGVVPKDARLVLYVHTDAWYVQPLIERPFTTVAADGTWSSDTHTGTCYAALLVDPTLFKPQPRIYVLPPVGEGVLAVTEVEGKRK